MKESRTKKSLRNIIAGLINRIISLLVPFVIRTLIIQKLGVEYLGLNSLFSSILQVLSLTELGFGSAMVYSMYKPIADGDIKQVNSLLCLYKKVYKYMGAGILAIGIMLIPFLENLIASDYPETINIYLVYSIYLANTVVSYFLYAYKSSLLVATMRSDIDSVITGICNVGMYLLQALLLILFSNYYIYALLLPIFTAINNIVRSVVVDRRFPEYRAEGVLDDLTVKDIKKRVFALAGHRLGGVIFTSADSIVISAFLGLVVLGRYSNYFYIYTAINGIMSVIFQSIIAIIGNSIVTESKEKNRADFFRLFFINGWISGFCAICFLCMYQPFIKIWIGDKNLLRLSVPVLLSVYFFVANIRRVETAFKDAAGMWNDDFWKPYVSVLVNITVNIILVKTIGLEGVIISSIAAVVLIEIPWEVVVLFRRYFNSSIMKYCMDFFWIALVFFVASIPTYYICDFFDISIMGLIERMAACLIIPNLIAYIVFSRKSEFVFWKNKIKETRRK